MRFENYMRMLVVHLLLFWAKKQCFSIFSSGNIYTCLEGSYSVGTCSFP